MLETKKIMKLTPEQESYLPIFRQKYFDIGTSTEKADRTKAEKAITEMYKKLGKKEPIYLWGESYFSVNIFIAMIKKYLSLGRDQLHDQLRDQLGDQLRDQLGNQLVGQLRDQLVDQLVGQLRDQLGGQLHDQLRDQLGGQLRDQLVDQLGNQLRGQLHDQLRDQLGDQLRDQLGNQLVDQLGNQLVGQLRDQLVDQLVGQLRDQLVDQLGNQLGDQLRGQLCGLKLEYNYTYMWGQHDAYWISFYKFCEKIGVKYKKEDSKILSLWDDLAQSCGWWIPYDGICFISERHDICKFEGGVIHSEDSPCVKFRDGWAIYAINGHLVPEKVVMTPELITLEEIENESNAEAKRIMIDRYGTGKYLSDIGAKVIDIDSSNTFRSLIEDKNGNKFLEGTDGSTERVYFMPVPKYVMTCKEAHESICGLPEDTFLMQS